MIEDTPPASFGSRRWLVDFFRAESAGGRMLMLAALLAMLCANSPFAETYFWLFETPIPVHLGPIHLDVPFTLWINDGLMVIFFLLVGLEIKREMLEGELATPRKAALPAVAALGGMIAPALIYVFLNRGDLTALRGWAIPSATDIAFALSVLMLFGRRVPMGLKIFLTAVAVIDDLGAIVIIALFYTASLSLPALAGALACIGLLYALNRAGCRYLRVYLFIGIFLWMAVLLSGVHATLAGVALGLLIPHRGGTESMLKKLEHWLHPWVTLLVMPLFAFANAGLSFDGMSVDSLTATVPLGIALGLLLGKQIGVFSFSFIAIRSGLASLPGRTSWRQLYAVCVLCGVGFTMSLFIGSLAFHDAAYRMQTQTGVLMGSALSALLACGLLQWVLPKKR